MAQTIRICLQCGRPRFDSEKAVAPHSSTPAWKIPWMEEPGRLQSMRLLRVRHDWATSLLLFTFMRWRRKWQPTPVFLPGESQGWGSLVGCRLWGRTVGHDWSDLAAATGLTPAPGRSPGEGNGSLLQYSCLENSMDRGAWQATVCGLAKSQTWLSEPQSSSYHALVQFFHYTNLS